MRWFASGEELVGEWWGDGLFVSSEEMVCE